MDSAYQQIVADLKFGAKPRSSYTKRMQFMRRYMDGVIVAAGVPIPPEYEMAYKAYSDPLQREIIEALLLAEANAEDVKSAFGFLPEAFEIYRELFFDTRKFKTHLDKLSYVERYPNRAGKEIKIRALHLGPEYVYYTYSSVVPRTEQQKLLVRKMFLSSAYKAMSINYNSVDSSTSKAALEHAKFMVKAFEALENMKDDSPEQSSSLTKILVDRGVQLGVNVSVTRGEVI